MLGVLLATGLAMSLALVVYWASLVWRAPSENEAHRVSVSRPGSKALVLAFAVDPSFCSWSGRGWFSGGEVICADVPLHLFEDRKVCDIKGLYCRPEHDSYRACVSYEWTLDLLANPSNTMSSGDRHYASVSTGSHDCNKGWTQDDVRRQLAELGLASITVLRFADRSRSP